MEPRKDVVIPARDEDDFGADFTHQVSAAAKLRNALVAISNFHHVIHRKTEIAAPIGFAGSDSVARAELCKMVTVDAKGENHKKGNLAAQVEPWEAKGTNKTELRLKKIEPVTTVEDMISPARLQDLTRCRFFTNPYARLIRPGYAARELRVRQRSATRSLQLAR